MKVEGRLDFVEKVDAIDTDGRPRRSIRRVRQAAVAVNNEVRRIGSQVRPAVSLLVAERRGDGVNLYSLGGSLTRPELDLLQEPADPLDLPSLLPEKPMKVGEKWPLSDEAARALSDYDALASNRLEAKLEEVSGGSARIAVGGEVRGAHLGGEGSIRFKGSLTFDRKAGRVDRLELDWTESRKPGPVELGLEVKSRLTIERRAVAAASDLGTIPPATDEAKAARELLVVDGPGGKAKFLHDRRWFLAFEDDRQVVLKRLDQGEVIAQCNLALGPNAGKGRHQDLGQFRGDIKAALGPRFGRFAGDGEVDGPAEGGFRYRATIEGKQDGAEIVWHYYLLAGPSGDQVIATFTLGKADGAKFADQDLRIVGTTAWRDDVAAAEKPK